MKELLLLLCRYPYEERNRESLSGLISAVDDWEKTVNLINAHGIIALAAYNLREAKLEHLVPEDKMKIIDAGYTQSIVRNTWLTERWKEVNEILSDAGIKHVLLKGMALEHTLYGSKGLRQMNDNDILLNKDDALKAWHILQQHGFSHQILKSSLHKKILPDFGKHLPCLYKNGYAIELHHRLFDTDHDTGNPENHLMSALREIMISGTRAFILSEDLQLRHLVHHFNGHATGGGVQVRQYADIMLLDKNTKITMPDDFIMDPDQGEKRKFRKASYKKNLYSMKPSQRLRYIAGDIFPSLTWMKKRYNCSTPGAFLHYPERLGKLLWLI